MLKGCITALVTPFNHRGIDEKIFCGLVESQIADGIDGLVVAGCTGESFTLTPRERNRLLNLAKEQAQKRVPIILGTGSANQNSAIQMSANAKDLGADYVLVISPFGNKPSQDAIYTYYEEISKVSPPLIIYNVPSRTGMNVKPETIIALASLPNIVAVKEASGNLDSVSEIIRNAPDLDVFSGDDSLTLPMLSLGAKGVISTVSNIMPRQMTELCKAFFDGNIELARKLHFELFPLIKAIFLEGNPVPLKEAMNISGKIVGDARAPLGRMGDANREILINTLFETGLLGKVE